MYLKKLILTQFKNYEKEALDFSPEVNFFVGQNGMGKTNLLDAMFYLCMCKSGFGSGDHLVMQKGTDFFRLEGHFVKDSIEEKIVAKVIPRKKKEFERNGVAYDRLSEHIGLLPVVMIVPDDTLIAIQGSEERRRFMDNTLSQIDSQYLQQLILYNKTLKQRNAALRQFGESGRYNSALIDTYNEQLASPAQFIYEKRKELIEQLNPILIKFYSLISGDRERVDCIYKSQLSEKTLESLFLESNQKDRILQRTTTGTHKDDLKFVINEDPLKRFASQGQLKSFILALKLAQFELIKIAKEESPILLLDDIFDKLDQQRVSDLLALLLDGLFGQLFITDTHTERVEEIVKEYSKAYSKYEIVNGKAMK